MPPPEWADKSTVKRRRATVAPSLVMVPKETKPTPVAVGEDVDGQSDSSVGDAKDDCDSSSVGSDTSDTDLTNRRRNRGLPIVHKDPSSGSGHQR